jgi:PilZ domain
MTDQPTDEKRRHPRAKAGLPVELKQANQKYGIHGQTADLSVSGFYFETMLLLPVGTALNVRLWVGDDLIESDAVVRTCDPGVGNGIEFIQLSRLCADVLAAYLASIAREEEESGADLLRE